MVSSRARVQSDLVSQHRAGLELVIQCISDRTGNEDQKVYIYSLLWLLLFIMLTPNLSTFINRTCMIIFPIQSALA